MCPMTRRKRAMLFAAIAFIGVIALAAGAAVTYVNSLAQQFDALTHKIAEPFPEEAVRPVPPSAAPMPSPAPAPQNILLLGSDTRGAVGSVDDTGARSDTMMVVHIPADRSRVTVLSIMRDSWVSIPGHGDAKINAAMSWGGTPLAVQTLESLIGVRIDHVVVVDFEGLAGIAEALGGVDVINTIAFQAGEHFYPEGLVHLDGSNALDFVRERYSFDDADYQRVRNQQAFMSAVVAKVFTASTMLDPGTIQHLVTVVSPYLAVDQGFDSAYVGSLALELRALRADAVDFYTAPTLGTSTSDDGQSIVLLDAVRMNTIREAFMADRLAALPPETFQ